jgi:hypothetical protein
MFNSVSVFLLICLISCSRNQATEQAPAFETLAVKKLLTPSAAEISGIADSESQPGILWAIEDSGNPTWVYRISHTGQLLKKVFLTGISNRDWEDIGLFNGSLYIAETGDNNLQYPDYSIYILSEPSVTTDTVSNIQRIRFRYPDGSHDCEALIVEPSTRDIYLFTKSSTGSKVFKLSYPYDLSSVQLTTLVGTININGIVSATASKDNKEIILKTYSSLNYFSRTTGENFFQAVSKSPASIPYELEPQGEAVSFAGDNSGYFTLSEKGFASEVYLCFYKRK